MATIPNTWLHFLQQQGATLNAQQQIQDFGQPDIERYLVKDGPLLFPLTNYGVVEICGADALTFCQGQFTNDMQLVSQQQAAYSAYCDPQGRVLATVWMTMIEPNRYWLMVESSLIDSFCKRLQMFVLRSNVTIKDLSQTHGCLGYGGEFADLATQRYLDMGTATEPYQCVQSSRTDYHPSICFKMPLKYAAYAFMAPITNLMEIWADLALDCEKTRYQHWELLLNLSGIGRVSAATSGQYLPHLLNLDKVDAISFKKGCYTGQEVIARQHYRGKATKRLIRLWLQTQADETTTQSWINQPLTLQTTVDGKQKTVDITPIQLAPDIEQGVVCLAICSLKALPYFDQNTATLTNGEIATLEPLPYHLETAD